MKKTIEKRKRRAASNDAFYALLRKAGSKKYGTGMFVHPRDSAGNVGSFYTTTIPSLDVVLTGKVGRGFAAGRIGSLYGDYDTGKTTLGCLLMRSVQAQGGRVAVFDTESTLSTDRMVSLGVNPDRVISCETCMIEEVFNHIEYLIDAFEDVPGLIFVDTIASCKSKTDMGRDVGEQQIARHARILSHALRRLAKPLAKSRTALVLCNQLKAGDISNPFASERSRQGVIGGKAIPFHAAQILSMDGYKRVRSKKDVKAPSRGFSVIGTVVKTKFVAERKACHLFFDTVNTPASFNPALSMLRTLQQFELAKRDGRFVMTWRKKNMNEKSFVEMYTNESTFTQHANGLLERAVVGD